MISYSPLSDTLIEKGVTFDWLMRELNNRNLRGQLNSGKDVSVSTIEKICEVLDCKVEEVMIYKKDYNREPVNWIRGYEVDWGVVYDLLHAEGSNFGKASVAVGKKKSYFYNMSLSKISSKKTVAMIMKALPGYGIEKYAKPVVR